MVVHTGQQCHMEGKIRSVKLFPAPALTARAAYSVVSPSITSASPTIINSLGNAANPAAGVLTGLTNGCSTSAALPLPTYRIPPLAPSAVSAAGLPVEKIGSPKRVVSSHILVA